MLTTISIDGLLIISSENGLESYALNCWADENFSDGDEIKIKIVTDKNT